MAWNKIMFEGPSQCCENIFKSFRRIWGLIGEIMPKGIIVG